MAIEKQGYTPFPLPITGPVTSKAFPLEAASQGANITLGGTSFSVRVQVSNATNPGPLPDHLFIPPDTSFDTSKTLTASDPPQQIAGPIRFIRLILDSGTLTGANIEQNTRGSLPLDTVTLNQLAQTAGAAAGGTAGAQAGAAAVSTAGFTTTAGATLPLGPVNVVEESQRAIGVGFLRGSGVTFGLGAAAAGRSFTNVPGSRVQVNAVSNLNQLAGFGFDAVGDYVNMDANPGLYGVPAGVGIFTSTTVTVPTALPALAVPGMFLRTTHNPTWYAGIVAISSDRLIATVTAWYNSSTGATGTPPNGTAAVVNLNPLDKLFGRNLLVGIGTGAPTRVGVGEELDLYLAGGDANAAGYDAIILGDGSSSQRAAYQARHAPGAGRWKYGHSSLGAAYDASFASVPNPDDPGGLAPQFDYRAEHGTAGGYRSQGDRPHAAYYSGNGTEVFYVAADGSVRLKALAFGPAAVRSAAVPTNTALTVGATYTQAEVQAIIARVEQLRVRLADVEAKAVAAGLFL